MLIKTLGEAVDYYKIFDKDKEIKCLSNPNAEYRNDQPYHWRKGNLRWTDTVVGIVRSLEKDPSRQVQRTSLGEQTIYHFLADNLKPGTVANRYELGGYEFDVVLFNFNLVIEHQSAYHKYDKAVQQDAAKLAYLKANNINILYVSDNFKMGALLTQYGIYGKNGSSLCVDYKSTKSPYTTFELYKNHVIPQVLNCMKDNDHEYLSSLLKQNKLTPAEFKQAYIDSGNTARPGQPTMAEALPLYVGIMREQINRNGLDPSLIKRSDQHKFFITNRLKPSQPKGIKK